MISRTGKNTKAVWSVINDVIGKKKYKKYNYY